MSIENLILRSVGIRHNRGREECVKGIVGLIKKAKESIKIVAGDPNDWEINDPRIVQALGEKAAQGVNIKIITGPEKEGLSNKQE